MTVKLAFRTFGSMFQDVLENLERSKGLLYRSADIASFREAQDSRTLFKQQFDAQERLEMNDRRSTALEWLSHESCERFHEELQETRKRFPNTTRWVFNEKALQGWFGGQDRDQPFWISGMPGAGDKTSGFAVLDVSANGTGIKEKPSCSAPLLTRSGPRLPARRLYFSTASTTTF